MVGGWGFEGLGVDDGLERRAKRFGSDRLRTCLFCSLAGLTVPYCRIQGQCTLKKARDTSEVVAAAYDLFTVGPE